MARVGKKRPYLIWNHHSVKLPSGTGPGTIECRTSILHSAGSTSPQLKSYLFTIRVDLGYYDQDVDPILWKVVGTGDASYVLLRHVSNRLLRANGRYRLWLSGVSVDDVDNQSTMMHWKVETIPTSPNPAALPTRIPVSSARSSIPRHLWPCTVLPVPRPLLRCTARLGFSHWFGRSRVLGWNLQFRFVEPVLEAPALDVSLFPSVLPRTAKCPAPREPTTDAASAACSSCTRSPCTCSGRYGSCGGQLRELPGQLGHVPVPRPLRVRAESGGGAPHGQCVLVLPHPDVRPGRLTPLLVDLPRNEETVDIIVIIGTEGE
ncbi:uncharacterized protein [Setaria viridis]|uniref:uncharacterized protein n=1 Tax=Setaria viridis TaxID=4556 RepID=UPI003B3B63AE